MLVGYCLYYYAGLKFIWVVVLYQYIVGSIVHVGMSALRSNSGRALQGFSIQSMGARFP